MLEMNFMSAERITIDTNILVYSLDRSNMEKHQKAIKVLEKAVSSSCVLTMQSLSEFYAVTTRKKLLPHKIAQSQVKDWQALFPTIIPKPDTLIRAMHATTDYKLAFWDALLWATTCDAGVTILLSEDFQSNRLLGKVKIVNPFIDNPYWTI